MVLDHLAGWVFVGDELRAVVAGRGHSDRLAMSASV